MGDWTAVERCRKPEGWGRRHRLAIIGFCGFALSYAMRFSLSIAIVAMVNSKMHHIPDNDPDSPPPHPKFPNLVVFKSDICPHDDTTHEALDLKLNLFHVERILEDDWANRIRARNISFKEEGKVSEMGDGSESIAKNGSLSTSSSFHRNGDNNNKSSHEKPPPTTPVHPIMENISPSGGAAHVAGSVKDNKHGNIDADDGFVGEGEFFWNEAEQGVILGSFFWGYVVTQILGGWISQRIGGKWPFGVGLLITGLFTIVTPTAARWGGMNWLIYVRIGQGLAGGVTIPAMHSILSKWFPPEERGKLGSFTLAGMPFGTSMSMLCSGYLIHFFGWPSVFYATGILALLWFLLWSYLAHASPFDDPTIDQAELRYIQAALNKDGKQQTKGNSPPVPWCRVLLSLPFWAILICNTCETWGLYTINAELPTYMKTVLRFDIKQNSFMSAFPHLLTLLVSVVLTNVGDNLIERRYMSIGTVRKLSTSIAMWGSAAALLGVAYSGCDRVKTVALLATAISLNGGKFGGFLVNIIDIAPNYSGILMGIINTISSMPGFFAPWVAGMIINENPSLENWRLVFLITACVAFIGNVFFLLYASGEEQSWNYSGPFDDGGGDMAGAEAVAGNGNVIKGLQRNSSTTSSMESINQITLSRINKEEVINGVYIIPLNPIHADNDQEDDHHEQRRQQQAPPLFGDGGFGPHILAQPAIDNFHGEGRGQQQQQQEDGRNGMRCCA